MINNDDNKQLAHVSGNDVPTLLGFQKHEMFCLRRDRKPVRMCDLIFNGFFPESDLHCFFCLFFLILKTINKKRVAVPSRHERGEKQKNK